MRNSALKVGRAYAVASLVCLAVGCGDRAYHFGEGDGGGSHGEGEVEPPPREPDQPSPEPEPEPAPEAPAGIDPCSIVSGDVDGDGHMDVLVPNSNLGTSDHMATVLYGDGKGNLSDPVSYLAGAGLPVSAALGDLDEDGRLDILVANYDADSISVLNNAGGRDMETFTPHHTDQLAVDVRAGDLDHNGTEDVVVVNSDAANLTVFLSDGGVLTGKTVTVGGLPNAVDLADANDDGHPDLLVTDHSDGAVKTWLGNGEGDFEPGPVSEAGYGSADLGVGDFDRDGVLDVAVANQWGNSVSVLMGVGDGSFAAGQTLFPGDSPRRAEVGDMDGDGDPDLAVVNGDDDTVAVYTGLGNGTFERTALYPVGRLPSGVAPVDLNEDGRDDLVVSNQLGNTVSIILSP